VQLSADRRRRNAQLFAGLADAARESHSPKVVKMMVIKPFHNNPIVNKNIGITEGLYTWINCRIIRIQDRGSDFT
jgi:hypothetical protein